MSASRMQSRASRAVTPAQNRLGHNSRDGSVVGFLAAAYGQRFQPPALLVEAAAKGEPLR